MKLFSALKESWRLIFHYPDLALSSARYDEYWQSKRGANMGEISQFQRQRADWILERIQIGSSVLDIGCGDGAVLLYLRRNKDIIAIGADMSQYALDFLSKNNVAVINLNAEDDAMVDSLPEADHIVLFEVLEHMQNPEQFLKQVESKARLSIFFSIPNSGYFPYRLRLLLGRSIMQWRLHPGEHLRFWTLADLRWWLGKLGYLERTSLHVYEGIPVLNRVMPSLFGMAIVGEISCRQPASSRQAA